MQLEPPTAMQYAVLSWGRPPGHTMRTPPARVRGAVGDGQWVPGLVIWLQVDLALCQHLRQLPLELPKFNVVGNCIY